MGIICGNIVLLRERHVQPLSRQKEKLDHPDIGRQRIGMQRLGIGEVGIEAEQALDHRHNEAPLKQVRGPGLLQRQRGEESQIDGAIGGGARVERVDDVVGLAEPERQPDHQIGPDIADDILRDRPGVGKQFRHQVQAQARLARPLRRIGRQCRRFEVPAAVAARWPPAAIAHLHPIFVCDEPATAND